MNVTRYGNLDPKRASNHEAHRKAAKTPTRTWRRLCALPLGALLLAVSLSACHMPFTSTPQPCGAGTESYNGACQPDDTVKYLECIKGQGIVLTSEVDAGVTLPEAAGSTVQVAYKRSKSEDTTVALQVVRDCLALAGRSATSGTDRSAARQYTKQVTQYIEVVKQNLPAVQLNPGETLDCGTAAIDDENTCQVTITSTGVAPLVVTGVQVVSGAGSGDFTVASQCQGALNPGQSCTATVQFQPSASGERDATLIVHQNLPPPDQGTTLQLKGTGTGTAPPPGGHLLAVTVDAAAGPVEVTSSPAGIDCPGTCTAPFGDSTEITLTAAYDQGSGQLTWSGCDTFSGNTCTVDLTADRPVTAQLAPAVVSTAPPVIR